MTLMPMEGQVRFNSPQSISGASQQNTRTAFSYTAEDKHKMDPSSSSGNPNLHKTINQLTSAQARLWHWECEYFLFQSVLETWIKLDKLFGAISQCCLVVFISTFQITNPLCFSYSEENTSTGDLDEGE